MDTVNCIQRAIDFIEDNIRDELKSETIASHAFMSSFHFQRLFSAVRGMTLGEYIAHSMRNNLGRAAPENAEQAFLGGFAAIDETDFELIRFTLFRYKNCIRGCIVICYLCAV